MTVRLKGTDRYRKTRLGAVTVFAALGTVVLVLTVGALAPWVPTPPPERPAGRAGSGLFSSTEAPPAAAPQTPPGPTLGCGGDR